MKFNSKQYGIYAAAALQSLIQKAPFVDVTGEFGKQITEEENQERINELARSAHAYAVAMITTTSEFHNYLTALQ